MLATGARTEIVGEAGARLGAILVAGRNPGETAEALRSLLAREARPEEEEQCPS